MNAIPKCGGLVWQYIVPATEHVDRVLVFAVRAKVRVVEDTNITIRIPKKARQSNRWVVRKDGRVLVVAAPSLAPEDKLVNADMCIMVDVPLHLKDAVQGQFGPKDAKEFYAHG